MIIGNEIRFVEKMLKGVVKGESGFEELLLLTRYYYLHDGLTREEIKPILSDWFDFRNMGGKYGLELHKEESIKSALDKYANKQAFLNELESITITKSEWRYIQEVGRNERERKVLFTILCLYKVKAGLYTDNNRVRLEYTKLNNMAHVTFTKANRLDAFKHFVEVGAIELPIGHQAGSVVLNFVDNDGEPMVVIEDFESFHIYYDYLKSNKSKRIYRCKECGHVALKEKGKQYNSVKYCESCSEKRKAEQNRNRKNRAKE